MTSPTPNWEEVPFCGVPEADEDPDGTGGVSIGGRGSLYLSGTDAVSTARASEPRDEWGIVIQQIMRSLLERLCSLLDSL